MQMLRHPNVVTLWEVIDDPRSRKVYMIQEFMEGGSLLKEKYAVEPIPEQIAITKFVQAARGVQYIHSFGICHGDIKPSNILEDAEGRVSRRITHFVTFRPCQVTLPARTCLHARCALAFRDTPYPTPSTYSRYFLRKLPWQTTWLP